MTKREKIRILKRALRKFNEVTEDSEAVYGICDAFADVTPDGFDFYRPEDFGIRLPDLRYDDDFWPYCWPLNAKGAAIRRRVLKNAIKRLEK